MVFESSQRKEIQTPRGASIQQLTDAANVSWDVSEGAFARLTMTANRTLSAFTGGTSPGFYILEAKASGGTRTLALSSTYDRGDFSAPSSISSGDSSLYGFMQIGTHLLYLGELEDYTL